MKIEQIEKQNIDMIKFVDVTEMGNVIELKHMDKKNYECPIRVIDKDHYVILNTGELCECNHIENRSENNNSIRITMRKLRQLINCNVIKIQNCRWITITYAENMKDSKKLYEDTKNLIKRVRYKLGHFEYIHVAEPQERGAWHLHCLWVFDHKAPYIDQRWLSECWGYGSNVKVKKLDENIDNLGSYLTAYLCDMELPDTPEVRALKMKDIKDVECKDENGNIVKKRILKGARLHMYPPKFNLYRCSRGIKRPTVLSMPYFKAMKTIGDSKKTFESSVLITGDNFRNVITKEYYNTLRK